MFSVFDKIERLDIDSDLQKRKVGKDGRQHGTIENESTSKPSAVFKPMEGRQHTLSIALPGSIIAKYVDHICG